MPCDMCGAEEQLFRAEIEGSILRVCNRCSPFGKVLGEVAAAATLKKKPVRQEKESLEMIRPDIAQIIKQKRESLNLSQEEFAKKLNQKSSLIHKIETGHVKPSILLARKIGRFLNVDLIEEYEETHQAKKATSGNAMTIGDLIRAQRNE